MPYKVTIIQRTLPHYRIPFFEELYRLCASEQIQLEVIYGQGTSEEEKKGDEVEWDKGIKIKNFYIPLGSSNIVYQPIFQYTKNSQLIITEQAAKNIINPLLLFTKKPNQKIALWGHGKNFQTKANNSIKEKVKKYLNKKADYFFAYNDLSKKVMQEYGIEEKIICSVMNAVDTEKLLEELQEVTDEEISAFRHKYLLTPGYTAIFCSSMYSEKRLPFLIDAATKIKELCPHFKLLMVGAGPDQKIAENASEKYDFIIYLGKLYGHEKALTYRCADIMLNPGLVGLNILDSFTALLPMVTTNYPFHSPEVDYLENNQNGILCEDDEFVAKVSDLLQNPTQLEQLKNGCLIDRKKYTVQNMAIHYFAGIQACLNTLQP